MKITSGTWLAFCEKHFKVVKKSRGKDFWKDASSARYYSKTPCGYKKCGKHPTKEYFPGIMYSLYTSRLTRKLFPRTGPWEVQNHTWKLLDKDVKDGYRAIEEQLWAADMGLA